MAQTMRLTSFGPVPAVATLHIVYLVFVKHERKKIKTCTNGPNDMSRVVWACSRCRHFSHVYFVAYNLYIE